MIDPCRYMLLNGLYPYWFINPKIKIQRHLVFKSFDIILADQILDEAVVIPISEFDMLICASIQKLIYARCKEAFASKRDVMKFRQASLRWFAKRHNKWLHDKVSMFCRWGGEDSFDWPAPFHEDS